jgi:muramoyltetrapeptide carboxypeptidase
VSSTAFSFWEDIAEHPYRVERMLYQLHFAGILARQRAVLLGTFNGYELAENDNGYDAAAMVAHFRATLRIPLYTGLPFGPRPRQAHASGRRALRADRAKRPGTARAQ